jgi:hypothetical protein
MSEYLPEQTSDDTEIGWNDEDDALTDEDDAVTDEEYLADVPPHHEY